MDLIVLMYLDGLYFRGNSPGDGDKLFASLKFFLRSEGLGGEKVLARSFRAVRGWRKVTPVFQRLPVPWVVTSAIVGH
eukprot:12410578-Karenia_brevis.AAC.1